MAPRAKPLQFVGDARTRLQEFPESAQDDAGYALYRLQLGKEPNDWKPMPAIGVGVGEIRIRDGSGAFRVFYVAKFVEAVLAISNSAASASRRCWRNEFHERRPEKL